MRQNTLFKALFVVTAILGLSTHAAAQVEARAGQAVGRIAITNLTRGQVFAPAVVVTHPLGRQPVFQPGQAASAELAQLAEDGATGPLVAKLMAEPGVLDVRVLTGTNGSIGPGETASTEFVFDFLSTSISIYSMLVTTNDGFIGAQDLEVPLFAGATSELVPVWDAGTEANTESCAHVPGPPCGAHNVRMTEGAEGFVHIHAGISGAGDVPAAGYDWRNPAARIEVTGLDRIAGFGSGLIDAAGAIFSNLGVGAGTQP